MQGGMLAPEHDRCDVFQHRKISTKQNPSNFHEEFNCEKSFFFLYSVPIGAIDDPL